jgi:hypothetical protein
MRNIFLVALSAIILTFSLSVIAQETPVGPAGTQVATDKTPAAAENSDSLRKAAQNPVASLISVPVQENLNFGIQPGDRTQSVTNIQPVIPVSVAKDWNLIVRWISPIIYQPIPVPQTPGAPVTTTGVFGLGDMNPTFFEPGSGASHRRTGEDARTVRSRDPVLRTGVRARTPVPT